MICVNYRFPFGPADIHQTRVSWSIIAKGQDPAIPPIVLCSPDGLQPDKLDRLILSAGNYAD
jgi:hypothetical protein